MLELSHRFAIVSPPSVTKKKTKQEQAIVGESGSGGHDAKKAHNKKQSKAERQKQTMRQSCLCPL
jgi:hypothetical protein